MRGPFHTGGEFHQPLGRIRTAVEDDVFDVFQQLGRDVLVHDELSGVDNAHVHAGLDGVVEKGGVNRLPHHVVAAERERQVADAAAHLRAGAPLLDQRRRLDEGLCELVVLLDAGGNGEDVGVEDDVGRIEPGAPREQPVRALADVDLSRDGVGLPCLVERHDDHAGAVAVDERGLVQEIGLAFLQADRVHDGLALHALEPGLDDRPFRTVDHERHTRHFRLGRDVVQEGPHRAFGIEHALVHVHVEDVGAAPHLVDRDLHGRAEVTGLDQPREPGGARHVRALPDHLEVAVGPNRQRLEAAELSQTGQFGDDADGRTAHGLRDGRNVVRCRAAAAADDVQETGVGELAEDRGRGRRLLVVLAECIGQARVRITRNARGRNRSQIRQIRAHLRGTERAVDPDTEGVRVTDGDPEGFDRLTGECPPAVVRDRHRQHDGRPRAARLEHLLARDDCRLRIQRVEDGFDQQHVAAAVDQPTDLVLVGVPELVERRRAERRIVDVGRDRERAVGWPDGSGDETRLAGRACGPGRGRVTGEAGALDVQLVRERLETIVRLRDGGAVERIGLDDVGAGREVLVVYLADHVRAGEHEQIVVAPQIASVGREPRPAEVGLAEPPALDHRTHRAVEDEDAFSGGGGEGGQGCGHLIDP